MHSSTAQSRTFELVSYNLQAYRGPHWLRHRLLLWAKLKKYSIKHIGFIVGNSVPLRFPSFIIFIKETLLFERLVSFFKDCVSQNHFSLYVTYFICFLYKAGGKIILIVIEGLYWQSFNTKSKKVSLRRLRVHTFFCVILTFVIRIYEH